MKCPSERSAPFFYTELAAGRPKTSILTAEPEQRWATANVQDSAKRQTQGLVNFVHVVAYHICLALPPAFTQPRVWLLTNPSWMNAWWINGNMLILFPLGSIHKVRTQILRLLGPPPPLLYAFHATYQSYRTHFSRLFRPPSLPLGAYVLNGCSLTRYVSILCDRFTMSGNRSQAAEFPVMVKRSHDRFQELCYELKAWQTMIL